MKYHRLNITPYIILSLLPAVTVKADVHLSGLFSDHMVLQQHSHVAIWGKADPEEAITVQGSWSDSDITNTKTDSSGKWRVSLQTPKAGGPYEVIIAGKNRVVIKDVLIGEVWICSGQSNMAWPLINAQDGKKDVADANFPQIRLLNVPRKPAREPIESFSEQWQVCSPKTIPRFSAVGYYFGRELHQSLNVPIGLIGANWGGTYAEAWTRREILEKNPDFHPCVERQEKHEKDMPQLLKDFEMQLQTWKQQQHQAKKEGKKAPPQPIKPVLFDKNAPAVLYNSMIAPLIPYHIRGVVWYQGEANRHRAYIYRNLFPALIKNWRDDWNIGEFPFYYVQIAPYHYKNPDPMATEAAELRESQLLSLSTPQTGMAVTTDIGNINDIHPRNKKDVGKRLALWALAKTYDRTDLVYSGPLYQKITHENSRLRVHFDHVGSGLVAQGGDLKEFTLAGEDRIFHPAQAAIDGDTIIVSSNKVNHPVAVRFAWRNAPEPNLFNREGLPASPFRSDDWPVDTFSLR
ncbi:MAG: hypothetical protein JW709_01525 [Sedimentisphaerales bacterium]|nr:hypothetical protein [Sedimentisphaerales bacterium]